MSKSALKIDSMFPVNGLRRGRDRRWCVLRRWYVDETTEQRTV